MKEFTAKTVEEAVALAAEALGIDEKHLTFEVKEEKKSLFKKSATIAVYEEEDAAAYAQKSPPNASAKMTSSKSPSIPNATR